MPTYHSLGISASLLVTDLDQTLSNEILLRMGKGLQQDTKRIQDLLSKGRALREQPTGSKSSKVGLFQFLGQDEDMVLLVVEASDGQRQRQGDEYGAVKDGDAVQGECPEDANAVPASKGDTTPPRPTPMQNVAGSKKGKRVASSQRNDLSGGKRRKKSTAASTTPLNQITASIAQPSNTLRRPRSQVNQHDAPLALSLNIDCSKFYEKDKADVPLLDGKDLKVEVFVNGQLADVTYESSRPYKRSALIQYSGTRFHRQAEKPWVYVPTAAIASDDADITPDQRWDCISKLLGEEASQRGTDFWNQRPLSAQFLAALARSQLPERVKTKSQHFGVIDLVITAGTGRKFGPDTTYLTRPTRLSDMRYSGVAPVTDILGPPLDQDGDFAMQDGVYRFGDSPVDLTAFQPSTLTDDVLEIPAEPPHAPASPRTPKSMHMNAAQKFKKILTAKPVKKLISTYENAKGHVKGKRTLMQRCGDMSKMSPRKRQEVLDSMKDVLDEDTMSSIMAVFESDEPSERKKVRFSLGEDIVNPAPMIDEPSETQMLASAADPLSYDFATIDPSLLENNSFGSYPQLHPPTMDATASPQDVGPAARSSQLTPPKRISKRTPASALSGSPTSTPVKYHHSHRKHEPTMPLIDPFIDSPVTPQRTPGSARTRTKWIPDEQTSDQALEHFQIPDLCVRSTVSYADGLKQRQVSKARGGEFVEQQFVVGMRFIVL